jgi:hypothetical protein
MPSAEIALSFVWGKRMMALSLHQILTITAWFLAAMLIGFLALIARFYEDLTCERTLYRWFALPVVCFGIGSARYAFDNAISADFVANALWVAGGIVLVMLAIRLYLMMIRHHS